MNGYLHPDYAASLAEFGTPLLLPRSRAWLLARPIAGSTLRDCMGCYPLFACENWSALKADLDEIAGQFASVSLVTDPFGAYDVRLLTDCFGDVVRAFKQHHVVDLRRSPLDCVCDHHQRNARRALEQVMVQRVERPAESATDWVTLYANLIRRHGISGISAFSEQSLALQLAVPGATVFRARHDDQIVGMLVWYTSGGVGYYHLGAYSELGYELRASFALFWTCIEYFAASGLEWLNLGAGAGTTGDDTDGLNRFKRGWSTGTRAAYFCGRIFDHEGYTALLDASGVAETDYFPAYRARAIAVPLASGGPTGGQTLR